MVYQLPPQTAYSIENRHGETRITVVATSPITLTPSSQWVIKSRAHNLKTWVCGVTWNYFGVVVGLPCATLYLYAFDKETRVSRVGTRGGSAFERLTCTDELRCVACG